jgi:hypothetical protein
MALTIFLIRWGVNWVLLNRTNKTDFFSYGTSYSFEDLFPIIRHIAISEFKFWWKGSDHANLKRVSNFLSVVVYSSVFLIVAMIIFIL